MKTSYINIIFINLLLLSFLLLCTPQNLCGQEKIKAQIENIKAEKKSTPVACGNENCPDQNFICCDHEKKAPAECCLKEYAACYSGGGFMTGWPKYNGCNPKKCLSPKSKLCKGSKRNTCCEPEKSCGSSFGIAYCEDKVCPKANSCNDGKLCCSKPSICKEIKNVEYCDEPCEKQGKIRCNLKGDYYGSQPFHLCCQKNTCSNHPDGWPFCKNEVN